MIVIDNSILIAALTQHGPAGALAAKRLRGERIYAPALIDVEAISALRGLLRGGKVTQAWIARALDGLDTIPLERVPHTGLLARMWELRDNVTAYDAAYVALAENLNVPLLTGDARLAGAPGLRCAVELIR